MKYTCMVGGNTKITESGAKVENFVFKTIPGKYQPYIFIGKFKHRDAVINITNISK